MPLNIAFENAPTPHRHVTIVRLDGKLTAETALAFRSAVGARTAGDLLADMRGLSSIDKEGASALLSPVARLGHERFKLFGCPEPVEQFLRGRNLFCLFESFADTETALRSFGLGRPRRLAVRMVKHPGF